MIANFKQIIKEDDLLSNDPVMIAFNLNFIGSTVIFVHVSGGEVALMLKKILSVLGILMLLSVAWFSYRAYWEDPYLLDKEIARYNFDELDARLTGSCISMLRDMPIKRGMSRGELCGCSSNSVKNTISENQKILLADAFQHGSESITSNNIESAIKYLIFNNNNGDFIDNYINEIGICADNLAMRT